MKRWICIAVLMISSHVSAEKYINSLDDLEERFELPGIPSEITEILKSAKLLGVYPGMSVTEAMTVYDHVVEVKGYSSSDFVYEAEYGHIAKNYYQGYHAMFDEVGIREMMFTISTRYPNIVEDIRFRVSDRVLFKKVFHHEITTIADYDRYIERGFHTFRAHGRPTYVYEMKLDLPQSQTERTQHQYNEIISEAQALMETRNKVAEAFK